MSRLSPSSAHVCLSCAVWRNSDAAPRVSTDQTRSGGTRRCGRVLFVLVRADSAIRWPNRLFWILYLKHNLTLAKIHVQSSLSGFQTQYYSKITVEAIRCCRFFLNVFGRIIWVFLSTGIWVYPLLGLFSTSGLVGFFIFNMSVVTLLYVLGEKLNHRVWSKNLATNKELHGHAVMSLLHGSLVLCCREESAQTFG